MYNRGMQMRMFLAGLCLIALSPASRADSFDVVKKELADAACVRFEFISIIESDLFDVVDSTSGSATIASDGRYRVALGPDVYLRDGLFIYSYSEETNQVVIERVDSTADDGHDDNITYITDLDRFFDTHLLEPERKYRLTRTADDTRDMPDSMVVFVDPTGPRMTAIEFLDVNGELNRIVFLGQAEDSVCAETAFEAAFPDSVERVKLF